MGDRSFCLHLLVETRRSYDKAVDEREAAYHKEEPAHALPVGLPVGQVLLHPRDAGLEVDLALRGPVG